MYINIKNNQGVTLIELIVAVGVFSVIMISATGIFMMVTDSQRNAISAQNVQEGIKYALEMTAKESRAAVKSEAGECPGVATSQVYYTNGTKLYFKNKDGQCVIYEHDNNKLQITRGALPPGYITPASIKISNLKFVTADEAISQPMVTLNFDVEAVTGKTAHKQAMKIQTTISARYYE